MRQKELETQEKLLKGAAEGGSADNTTVSAAGASRPSKKRRAKMDKIKNDTGLTEEQKEEQL